MRYSSDKCHRHVTTLEVWWSGLISGHIKSWTARDCNVGGRVVLDLFISKHDNIMVVSSQSPLTTHTTTLTSNQLQPGLWLLANSQPFPSDGFGLVRYRHLIIFKTLFNTYHILFIYIRPILQYILIALDIIHIIYVFPHKKSYCRIVVVTVIFLVFVALVQNREHTNS